MIYKKQLQKYYIFLLLGLSLAPIFGVEARSDLDGVWNDYYREPLVTIAPIDTRELAHMALFLVHIFVAIGVMFAIIYIFVGWMNMHLSSGNEDDYFQGKFKFWSGLIFLIVGVVFYLSIDTVVIIVQDLASKFA